MPAQAELDRAIELLDRALGYTRGVLAELDRADPPLSRRTPCRQWDLGQLLAHMEDALDAFTEGAGGCVALEPRIPVVARTDALRQKACGLLGTWSSERPDVITIGDQVAPASVVVAAAALEITVHGWDVAQTINQTNTRPAPIPEELAASLLPVADALVSPHDRESLFEPVLEVADGGSAEEHLLAYLGRDRSIPLASFQVKRGTGSPIAS
jgi:uncharacterized protein (TIGR03086 family)